LQPLQLDNVDFERGCAARGVEHSGLCRLCSGDRCFEPRDFVAIQCDLIIQFLRHHGGIREFERAVRGVVDLLAAR
jgi:hypothetical protein